MTDILNVGLVGYGMAGRVFHAPVISAVPGLRLAKVVERRSEESRKRYPSVEVVRDASALFADEGIDLVVVATPTATHVDLASEALRAGKHVVVEKPFAATAAEADRLVDLAREHGRLLTVYQNRRWDGDFATVRRVVESGVLGRLVDVESHFDRYRPALRPGAWREAGGPGSGLLFDIGSHLVDQALVLFGLPAAVSANVRAQREGAAADDRFDIVLDYGELRVRLGAGLLARTPRPRFLLHGTRGSFVKNGLDPQERALSAGRTPAEPGWGEEPRESWGALDAEVDGLHVEARVETLAGAYQRFYENVRDAVAGRAALEVTAEQARDAIRVLELAAESSRERRAVPYSPR